MSTPERRTDRPAWSRRNHEQQQQQQQLPQQHSPYRRTYLDSRSTDRFDASKIPSPSQNYSARRRRTLGQSNTLRGAFEAVGRRHPTTTMENDHHLSYSFGSPGRTGTRRQSINPMSPESNPPNELVEAYRQIDDADSLVDQDELDDDQLQTALDRFRESRGRASSFGSSIKFNDVDFLNDITDESSRRKPVDRVRDEQRLRRATSSRSPVFNRTGTTPALTSENLQRREEEEQQALQDATQTDDDYDDGLKPSLNLPRNWGTRGTHRRDWLKSMARRGPEPENVDQEPKDTTPPKSKFDYAIGLQSSPPERTSPGNRSTLGERLASTYNRFPLADARNRPSSQQKEDKPAEANHTPNTPPVMVYKNSTFNKRSPTKRDSHDLLRKLSRTESPSQAAIELRTPEAQKPQGPQIYDKTPVVTGAWIDTPMTERPTSRPNQFANPTEPSPGRKSTLDSPRKNAERVVKEPQTAEPHAQNNNEKDNEQQRIKEADSKKEQEAEKAQEQQSLLRQKPEEEKPAKNDQKEAETKTEVQDDKTAKGKKRPLLKPDLPKSALATVMEDLKANKDSLDVGDDTLESLQEILNEQATEVKTEAEDDAAYEKSVLEKLARANSTDRDTVDLDSMNQKLHNLAENMSQVHKGIDGLKDQVSSIPSPPKTGKDAKPGTGCGSCEACQAHNDGRIYTIIPLPKLWTRDAASGRIRPTRLGWTAIVLFAWFWSESTMCDFYCHPFIADVCKGNCLRPDAPRFPFVIPTMLWRWSHLSALLTPLWALSIAFFRLVAQLLGFWDGYVDEPSQTLNLTGEIWVRGSRLSGFPAAATAPPGSNRASKPWQEQDSKVVPEAVPELNLRQEAPRGSWEDGSMEDDEYI